MNELLKSNFLWLTNPTTKLPDSMLSFAVYGFVFSLFFMSAALYIAAVTNKPDYLKYLAEIIAALYAPTIAAYTFNAHSKRTNPVGSIKEPETN